MHNSPTLRGFTFTHPPDKIQVHWEPLYVKHGLADGAVAIYNKGFKLMGKLEWKKSWLTQNEYSAVQTMYNNPSGTSAYWFYPKPTDYPTRKFAVQLTDGFDFVPMNNLVDSEQAYVGSIVFESSVGSITATASEVF